ncbi:MAG: hypothetical protein ABJC05_12760 [Pyrinomonadaceae bacterium]
MTSGAKWRSAAMVWDELDEDTRATLANKLDGLYGYDRSAAAFDSIPVDKQQALLLIMRRLTALNLWSAVRRIDNIYGEGGVGMYFTAWPFLEASIRRRRDFTRWFARHADNHGGFLERTRPMAALHFLYIDNSPGNDRRHWNVHFDLHSGVASPFSTVRHLVHERLLGHRPDWIEIKACFDAQSTRSS